MRFEMHTRHPPTKKKKKKKKNQSSLLGPLTDRMFEKQDHNRCCAVHKFKSCSGRNFSQTFTCSMLHKPIKMQGNGNYLDPALMAAKYCEERFWNSYHCSWLVCFKRKPDRSIQYNMTHLPRLCIETAQPRSHVLSLPSPVWLGVRV